MNTATKYLWSVVLAFILFPFKGVRMTNQNKKLTPLVVGLLFVALVVKANAHTCAHNTLKYPLEIVSQPAALTSSRAMSPQSTTFRPIRIFLNYTFLDNPDLDVNSYGNAAVCQTVGQRVIVGGVTFTDNPCLNAENQAVAQSNCYFYCNTSDISNAARVTKAKEIMEIAKTRFESFLKVQDFADVTIGGGYKCGGMPITNQTYAADVIIMPTVRSTPYLPTTLAFASPCQIHEVSSRPILMHVNIQPSTLETNSDMDTVVTHEMTHGLGFSVDMYKFYRHPNDPSKTYIEYDPVAYPYGPLQSSPNAVTNNNTNGRFGPEVHSSALGAGKKIELISPNVVATAKDFFRCPSITSVELENNGPSSSAGTHWEERILYWELMTSVQKAIPGKLTNFTLSLFKDMGFYDVDRAAADPMDYGFGKGCDFVQKLCNESNWYFCTEVSQQTCGYNNQYIGGCNAETRSEPFPVSNQYFKNEPNKGGSNDFLDNCPFATPLSNGACTDQITRTEFVSVGGASSRCYVSTLVRSEYNSPGAANTLCFATLCKDAETALLKLDDELYECPTKTSVELQVFPRFTQGTSTAPKNITGKAKLSAVGYGVLQCPEPVATCDPAVSDLNPDIIRVAGVYPTIEAVQPFFIPTDGGEVLTIVGTGLAGCSGLRVGGLATTDFLVINDTHATATSPAISTSDKYGGSEKGRGYSQADLKCSVTGCTNCYVGSTPVEFVEPSSNGAADAALDAAAEFFGTTTGLAVAGVVGVLLLALLGYCIYQQCCKKQQPPAPRKGKRGMQVEGGEFSQEML